MTVQTIQLTTSATTLDLGQQFLVTVGYDVDTGESALTGIGVRLHYDSTELQFDTSSILFANNLFGSIADGVESFDDGDSETDREITFQYVDFAGAWPNTTLPVNLVDLTFSTLEAFDGSQINVTFSTTTSGYEGQGDSLELTSFGTDTGSSTGSDTGAGTDTGSDTGTGIGSDTGTGIGSGTGQSQILLLSTPNTEVDTNEPVLVTVAYDVTDGDNTLTGVAVRVHYDSSELQFDNSSILFANSLFGDILDGGESFDDGDSETDREITFQYVDFVGNFPNTTLPVDLLTLAFTTLGGFNGSSLNVTFTSTASGYEGQGDSLELTSFGTDTGSGSTLTISPLEADKPEGNSGSTPFTFEVTRTGNTDNFLTVNYQVVGSISNSADAEDFIGNQVETVTTSRQVTIPSIGQELGVSLTLPDTSEDTSLTATVLISQGDVTELSSVNIAYVIDVSGSTFDPTSLTNPDDVLFVGTVPVGDLNGDGDANEILDAQIAAFEALNRGLAQFDFANQINVGIIPFAGGSATIAITTPIADSNGDQQSDISDVLRSITPIGSSAIEVGGISIERGGSDDNGTDYDDALQEVIRFFNALPAGDNFIFFLSDGGNNATDPFTDDVETLIEASGINAEIRAIGVGQGANLSDLDLLDDNQSNNSAEVILDPDALTPQLIQSPIEVTEINRVELYRNGTLIRTIAGTDLTNTPLGLQYTVALDGLDLLANDTIEARVIATDSAATTVATSQVVEASESVSTLPAGTLTFTAGETTKVLTINVAGDTNIEPNENFNVIVTDPSGLTDTASGVIENDDLSPVSSSSVLFGTPQADTLDATTGQYTVIPLTGDDTILVNTASDVIIELPNEGTDTIASSVNYNLAALTHIENLTLTGTDDITGIGNRRDNIITGNSGQNVLVGLQGDDTFVFNFGDSTVAKPDRIRDFGVGQDRIQIGDRLLAPSELPSTTNNTATTLSDLVNSVFADADGALSGNQPLAIDSAALVTSTRLGITNTYLVANDEIAGFNAETDLIINIASSSVNTPIFIL